MDAEPTCSPQQAPTIAALRWFDELRAGKTVGSTGWAVFAAIAYHLNGGFQCWPSYRRLRELSGLDRHTIAVGLRRLEQAGMIIKRKTPGQGTVYTIPLGGGQFHTSPQEQAVRNFTQPQCEISHNPSAKFHTATSAKFHTETANRTAQEPHSEPQREVDSSALPLLDGAGIPPPVAPQQQAQKPPKRSKPDKPIDWAKVEFPDGCDTPEVRKAILDWLEYHRRIGKPYKMAEKQVSVLLKRYGRQLTEAIEYSISQGYQGCFLPSKPHGKPQAQDKPKEKKTYANYLEYLKAKHGFRPPPDR
jgi:hypothetical protein